jgi:hypothetical protein
MSLSIQFKCLRRTLHLLPIGPSQLKNLPFPSLHRVLALPFGAGNALKICNQREGIVLAQSIAFAKMQLKCDWHKWHG